MKKCIKDSIKEVSPKIVEFIKELIVMPTENFLGWKYRGCATEERTILN